MSTTKDQPQVIVIGSTSVAKLAESGTPEGVEEIEIVAQITVPSEGGWGWVVVFTSLLTITIIDGITFNFGAMFSDLTEDIESTSSSVAFINAFLQASYYMLSPAVSAFINRFGFRAAGMTGSVIASFSLLCCYFSTSYGSVLFFYGILVGTGFSFVNVSSLIVGFYFEKLRSLALSISSCGSSVGIMMFYPVNAYIVKIAGWRLMILLHAGLNGLSFFLCMTYRPLLSLSVTQKVDDDQKATRTVAYLPSLKNIQTKTSDTTHKEVITSTPTERLFSAVANVNYPTASEVVNKGSNTSIAQPGPSVAPTPPRVHDITVTAQTAPGGMSTLQLNQVKSMMSKAGGTDKNKRRINLSNSQLAEKPKKSSCCSKLCHWEKHVPSSRPMYRDDVFYEGKLKNLPAYQKSVLDTKPGSRTGLEYQLAVTRVASVADIHERRQGICSTATRRVLSTMMSPKLLKKKSFFLVNFSGLVLCIGLSVPYVFLQERNLGYGLDPDQCSFFVSAIGFMNIVGKLVIGAIACKLDPIKVYIIVNILSGVSTILSDVSKHLFYQYFYSFVYGFFISSVTGLRSMVLVKICGLENLTNASGLALLFQGLGSFISTPAASVIKTHFGVKLAFIWAGSCMIVGGLLLMPVQYFANKESKEDSTYLT